jgi:two-component system, LuxR family, sensor kinase FixL
VQRRDLRISAAVVPESLIVRICDSGPGVQYPDRLFRPLDPTADAAGLGLFISRAMARNFGGNLTYEAAPERGSCFAVHLRREEQTGEAHSTS